MKRPWLAFIALITALPMLAAASERPLLHPLFSDNAVLQRGCPVNVWGWAEPGTTVTVEVLKQSHRATAGEDGKWTCTLDPLEAIGYPFDLTAKTDTGRTARASMLLSGDVWLCSGQSNMEMGIGICNEDEEINNAHHAGIRLMTVPHQTAYSPQETLTVAWKPCTPDALRDGGWGGFSATAYFFGKTLHKELGVPIGLIHSSWGGTIAEAWTSGPALAEFPSFQGPLKEVAALANSTAAEPEVEYLNTWFTTHDPGTAKGWFKADADASAWRKVTVPGRWADFGIPGYEGVVWAQCKVDLPASWADKPLIVNVGEIADNDTTWVNGTEVGRTNQFNAPRSYPVPAGIAKTGTNTVTVRITNSGGGYIFARKHPLNIHPQGEPDAAITLEGAWRVQETAKKADTGRPLVGSPNVPSVLYNGMIAPLGAYSMTGAIWYQGEANASRGYQYRSLLPTLISDWRRQFDNEELAFHIVSLANYKPAVDHPRDHPWAELREAQAMTAMTVPHCGLAVTIDIGEAGDIHPKNKRDVGKRLALTALENTYAMPVTGSGPWFRSATVEGNQVRVLFNYSDGLAFKGDSSQCFAIAGADRKFHWATARIDGDSVMVSSPEVQTPVAVRYAWDTNPQAPLYNGAGLPAVPFRTDDWPGVTAGK